MRSDLGDEGQYKPPTTWAVVVIFTYMRTLLGYAAPGERAGLVGPSVIDRLARTDVRGGRPSSAQAASIQMSSEFIGLRSSAAPT
jgi:hypothetical protein